MLTIKEIKDRIMPVCKKYNLKNAYLFGSYAKGLATEDSDIDLRLTLKKSSKFGIIAFAKLEAELREVLDRKIVDIITYLPTGMSNEAFSNDVRKTEALLYGTK